MKEEYSIESYDYRLPEELIVQHALKDRSSSRMLVLKNNTGTVSDRTIRDLPEFLQSGDCLVLNNSKVIPARLRGTTRTGAKIEILLIEKLSGVIWEAMMKNSRRTKPGDTVTFKKGLTATLAEKTGKTVKLKFDRPEKDLMEILEEIGETPLPPYITTNIFLKEHRERYQTVYAKEEGSSAAPTAGLHFTKQLIAKIKKSGVSVAEVTLHVGPGTFEPVISRDIREHRMHEEIYSVSREAAEKINKARRVIAVGTTSMRVIETAADENGLVRQEQGRTGIFIYPGYRFKRVNALLTNFHLPKSTLLMLVCAFAGYESTFNAYNHAIAHKYRFFSYGDCMLII